MRQFYIRERKGEMETTMQDLLRRLDEENLRVIDVVFIRDFDCIEEMIVIADDAGCVKADPAFPDDAKERIAEWLSEGGSEE